MMRRLLPLLFLSTAALATQRFPLPEFTSGYTAPQATHPLPPAAWHAYLDVGLLALALGLAAYLSLRKRSRTGVFVLMLASLAYFGFYRHGCVCPVGSVQNVAQAIWGQGDALPLAVAAFFLLPLLFALFCGRVFCAAVCPLGAAQDLVLLKPLKAPAWLESALGVIPYLYLGAAVLFAATGSLFLICKYDPFIAFFRLGGSATMLAIGVGVLAISTVVGRPYCRFLCPYSVLLRWLSPLSRWQVRITPGRCVNCRLCEDACPFGAIAPPTAAGHARREGKGRLALLLLLLPLLLALGGWLGYHAGPTLARVDPTVRTAEMVLRSEHGTLTGALPEQVTAFQQRGQASAGLYRQAAQIQRKYRIGSLWLGLWMALVIGVKLILLSIRRTRDDYEADPARCLACGRCYRFCPLAHERVGETTAALP